MIDARTGQFKWSFYTGDSVWCSPTIVDGVLYTDSDDHNVYAVDVSTHQVKWSFSTHDGAPSSPTVVNGVLYVGTSDHKVYAIDTRQ